MPNKFKVFLPLVSIPSEIIAPEPFHSIRVLNMLGQAVKEYKSIEAVDLSEVPAGAYFLQLVSQNSIETKKIIVE